MIGVITDEEVQEMGLRRQVREESEKSGDLIVPGNDETPKPVLGASEHQK